MNKRINDGLISLACLALIASVAESSYQTGLLGAWLSPAIEEQGPPMLTGYGCKGASGPLYAREESDFPICESIHR